MSKALRRIAIGAIVVLGLGASGLVCQRVAARGRYASAFSTYGAGPDGTRGLYLLAQELGARPQRWAEDLGRLPERGMLVALGSCDQFMRREVSRVERENLRRWVERGGVLVVAGVSDYLDVASMGVELVGDVVRCQPERGLLDALVRAPARNRVRKETGPPPADEVPNVEELPEVAEQDPEDADAQLTQSQWHSEIRGATPVGGLFGGLPRIPMRRALDIFVDDDLPSEVLLRLDGPEGAPAAVRVEIGRGAVIALGAANAFTNGELREGGGLLFARLVRAYAPESPILFDEYHLGAGEQRSMMRYLRQVGATAIALQLIVLVALALYRVGARFGGTTTEPPSPPGGTASYVGGVASLFAKSGDPEGAGRIIVRRAIARIAAHYHLPTTDPDRLVQLLTERSRHEAGRSVVLLARLLDGKAGARGLSQLAEEVDALLAKATADGGVA